MNLIRKYKVAGHLFELRADAGLALWSRVPGTYGPFEVAEEDAGDNLLFSLSVCDGMEPFSAPMIYSNRDSVEEGFIILNVFKDENGHYFEFVQPYSNEVNGRLSITHDYKTAKLSLYGSEIEQWLTLNTGMNFCFLLSTARLNTVLAHSSCVTYKGKAWMFLGKSGTGKSTHSRMWLNALEDVVLMNDDHPVIRIDDEGRAIAYGSPWSGKTRCYKNMEAPVGGIIRIARAPYNKARRLSPIESYASLMTSFSGMTWEKDLADGRDRTIQSIISKVPCWVMECLPDEDAARVCSAAVTEV